MVVNGAFMAYGGLWLFMMVYGGLWCAFMVVYSACLWWFMMCLWRFIVAYYGLWS